MAPASSQSDGSGEDGETEFYSEGVRSNAALVTEDANAGLSAPRSAQPTEDDGLIARFNPADAALAQQLDQTAVEEEDRVAVRQADWSRSGRIPIDVVEGLVTDKLAHFARNSKGEIDDDYAVVTTVIGDELTTIVVEKNLNTRARGSGRPYYQIAYTNSTSLSSLARIMDELSTEAVEELIAKRQDQNSVDAYASIARSQRLAARPQADAVAGTFVLHMIPLGAAADFGAQGEYGEAAIAKAQRRRLAQQLHHNGARPLCDGVLCRQLWSARP